MDEDRQLLDKIIARDEQAMESFYNKHSAVVYAFALKTLKNPVDAAEILNEVMLEVWKKAATFSAKSSVKTWLLSITHHKAVDQVRRNVRHDHEDESHIDDESTDNLSCSLLDLQISGENKDHVKYCLNDLSDSHRQVVYLAFFEGCSYPEISETLSIPSGTVKTRMMHAKKKLFVCLSHFLSSPQIA